MRMSSTEEIIAKTKFMSGSRDILPNVNLQLNEEKVERVNKFKYLGRVVDDK